jgi:hypothetical protein
MLLAVSFVINAAGKKAHKTPFISRQGAKIAKNPKGEKK